MNLQEFKAKFFIDPIYEGFDASPYKLDLQGWQSTSPVFEHIVNLLHPTSILEVGTWKGASAIHMAKLCKAKNIKADIVCVDTWLGSGPVWWTGEFRKDLMLKHGFPQMYYQFLANVVLSGCQDVITPLPLTSFAAAHLFKEYDVIFDGIYIDSSHDLDETYIELNRFYPLVRKNGILFGDDYSANHPGVVTSVNRFAYEQQLMLTVHDCKWIMQKP